MTYFKTREQFIADLPNESQSVKILYLAEGQIMPEDLFLDAKITTIIRYNDSGAIIFLQRLPGKPRVRRIMDEHTWEVVYAETYLWDLTFHYHDAVSVEEKLRCRSKPRSHDLDLTKFEKYSSSF